MISFSVLAQTPDGQTPPNEGICDPLMADGTTKGLYGLCVAFCEAQDHSSILAPVTEAELQILSDSKPSGRILENYNKKKIASDPEMPCLVVESACPCWSDAEIQSVDGVMWDGDASDIVECLDSQGPAGTSFVFESVNSPNEFTIAQAFSPLSGGYNCRFEEKGNAPGGSSTKDIREVTPDEYNICRDSVVTRTTELKAIGFCSP
jgi:hypothetical protein